MGEELLGILDSISLFYLYENMILYFGEERTIYILFFFFFFRYIFFDILVTKF